VITAGQSDRPATRNRPQVEKGHGCHPGQGTAMQWKAVRSGVHVREWPASPDHLLAEGDHDHQCAKRERTVPGGVEHSVEVAGRTGQRGEERDEHPMETVRRPDHGHATRRSECQGAGAGPEEPPRAGIADDEPRRRQRRQDGEQGPASSESYPCEAQQPAGDGDGQVQAG
jgi:hypothetical protein